MTDKNNQVKLIANNFFSAMEDLNNYKVENFKSKSIAKAAFSKVRNFALKNLTKQDKYYDDLKKQFTNLVKSNTNPESFKIYFANNLIGELESLKKESSSKDRDFLSKETESRLKQAKINLISNTLEALFVEEKENLDNLFEILQDLKISKEQSQSKEISQQYKDFEEEYNEAKKDPVSFLRLAQDQSFLQDLNSFILNEYSSEEKKPYEDKNIKKDLDSFFKKFNESIENQKKEKPQEYKDLEKKYIRAKLNPYSFEKFLQSDLKNGLSNLKAKLDKTDENLGSIRGIRLVSNQSLIVKNALETLQPFFAKYEIATKMVQPSAPLAESASDSNTVIPAYDETESDSQTEPHSNEPPRYSQTQANSNESDTLPDYSQLGVSIQEQPVVPSAPLAESEPNSNEIATKRVQPSAPLLESIMEAEPQLSIDTEDINVELIDVKENQYEEYNPPLISELTSGGSGAKSFGLESMKESKKDGVSESLTDQSNNIAGKAKPAVPAKSENLKKIAKERSEEYSSKTKINLGVTSTDSGNTVDTKLVDIELINKESRNSQLTTNNPTQSQNVEKKNHSKSKAKQNQTPVLG